MKSPIQYYGGKGNFLGHLLPKIPPGGKPYCEPFFGGGTAFFARPPAPVEVINDLDDILINLFRVLQHPELFSRLQHKLLYTLYSRAEFVKSVEILKEPHNVDPADLAWAKFVYQNQGMSRHISGLTNGNWSRVFISKRGVAANVNSWLMRLTMLEDWHKRLMMAQIDNRDAIEVIRYWDNPDAVFYVDPPYHPNTLADKREPYRFNMSSEQHKELIDVLLKCEGAVTLSGYYSPDYEILEQSGWELFQFETACHSAGRVRGSSLVGKGSAMAKVPRTECIWTNPRAKAMLWHDNAKIGTLFNAWGDSASTVGRSGAEVQVES